MFTVDKWKQLRKKMLSYMGNIEYWSGYSQDSITIHIDNIKYVIHKATSRSIHYTFENYSIVAHVDHESEVISGYIKTPNKIYNSLYKKYYKQKTSEHKIHCESLIFKSENIK